MLTKEQIQRDIDALPAQYKTADVDRLIRRYVQQKQDLSCLRPFVLQEQQFHRIYFHGSLKQIPQAMDRLMWINENLLFSDWWHTDQCIDFVKQAPLSAALSLARSYVHREDPFVRRWGYVMFISKLCRSQEAVRELLPLMHNDEQYYVQMAEAWLLAELAVFFPEQLAAWLPDSGLSYSITGKAVQKICDSYRIDEAVKAQFKSLRPVLKGR